MDRIEKEVVKTKGFRIKERIVAIWGRFINRLDRLADLIEEINQESITSRKKLEASTKNIAKVISETNMESFEDAITNAINLGYKIKYVNIDTKAGNSTTGVRYYAVVQKLKGGKK